MAYKEKLWQLQFRTKSRTWLLNKPTGTFCSRPSLKTITAELPSFAEAECDCECTVRAPNRKNPKIKVIAARLRMVISSEPSCNGFSHSRTDRAIRCSAGVPPPVAGALARAAGEPSTQCIVRDDQANSSLRLLFPADGFRILNVTYHQCDLAP